MTSDSPNPQRLVLYHGPAKGSTELYRVLLRDIDTIGVAVVYDDIVELWVNGNFIAYGNSVKSVYRKAVALEKRKLKKKHGR